MSCFVLGNTFNTTSPTIVNMANPKKYTALCIRNSNKVFELTCLVTQFK